MNKLLEHVIESRNGHYCHVFELESFIDFKSAIESIYEQSIDRFSLSDIIDFCKTIEVYLLDDDYEDYHNFNIEDFILSL